MPSVDSLEISPKPEISPEQFVPVQMDPYSLTLPFSEIVASPGAIDWVRPLQKNYSLAWLIGCSRTGRIRSLRPRQQHPHERQHVIVFTHQYTVRLIYLSCSYFQGMCREFRGYILEMRLDSGNTIHLLRQLGWKDCVYAMIIMTWVAGRYAVIFNDITICS